MGVMKDNLIKQLGIKGSIIIFLIPASILYIAHYYFVPAFIQATSQPYFNAYLIAWFTTMLMFFIASIYAYYKEGNPLKIKEFADRNRLSKMSKQDWIWVFIIFVIQTGVYFGLSFTSNWLARIPVFSPHPVFAPEFGPMGASAHVPGELMGTPLFGKWWIIPVYFFGWVSNIFGEEFWFRGYLLPRQEISFGKFAWVVNGLMFGFNHIWQPWNLLMIVPSALFGAFIVQRRKNTWILLIPHGIMNVSLLLIIILNLIGIKV
jgi:membrane protease YdiL (CAAX protease family)